MGNMEGFGGPLPPGWHKFSVTLQHQILQRMRSLGMTPVLPAFAGHIPKAPIDKYPRANFTLQPSWNDFPPTHLLDAKDPLFQQLGAAFIREYKAEFGTDHLYNCDTFNEMDPPTSDPEVSYEKKKSCEIGQEQKQAIKYYQT